MRRFGSTIVVMTAALSLVLVACSPRRIVPPNTAAQPFEAEFRWPGLPLPADLAIAGVIRLMEPRQLAGQLIIAGLNPDGTIPSGSNSRYWESLPLEPGGVVLYACNLHSISQVVELTNHLAESMSIPPFVGTDQEGGTVARMTTSPLPGTVIPAASRIGRVLSAEDESISRTLARQLGEVIGRELRSLGISLNFAPVADIAAPGAGGAIGAYYRSYGTEATHVARIVAGIVEGMQEAGVASVVKHFPGHGGATGDTHDGIAQLGLNREQLNESVLVPFVSAIAAGAAGIMTAHVALPLLTGSSIPATLSAEIVTGLLREELGYDGLVVTDALNMDAVAGEMAETETAVRSLQAGADMVLLPRDPVAVRDAIAAAVESGEIRRDLFRRSVRRVLLAKLAFGVAGPGSETAIGSAEELLGSAEHQSLMRRLSGIVEE